RPSPVSRRNPPHSDTAPGAKPLGAQCHSVPALAVDDPRHPGHGSKGQEHPEPPQDIEAHFTTPFAPASRLPANRSKSWTTGQMERGIAWLRIPAPRTVGCSWVAA